MCSGESMKIDRWMRAFAGAANCEIAAPDRVAGIGDISRKFSWLPASIYSFAVKAQCSSIFDDAKPIIMTHRRLTAALRINSVAVASS